MTAENTLVVQIPASSKFVEQIAEAVLGLFEIDYMQEYGSSPEMQVNYITSGRFTYRHNDFWDEIEVLGESFKWNCRGYLVSAPAKSEDEWIKFLNKLSPASQNITVERVA